MNIHNNNTTLGAMASYLMPCLDKDGAWGTVGGYALRESLGSGSFAGALDLLNSMSAQDMSSVLVETGFKVSPGLVEKGHSALLAEMQLDLTEAAALGVDGYGLSESRKLMRNFAAKLDAPDEALDFTLLDFKGDAQAAKAIQRIMHVDHVAVELLGEAKAEARASLLFIAGQALQNGCQGFEFDGIPGKYEVPLAMAEMVSLHHDAAKAVAEESARAALGEWIDCKKVGEVSEWVPDSIQRVLRASLSVSAASVVVNAIEGGMVGKHAGGIGAHSFARLLFEQGYDVNAITVDRQATELGLSLINPDRARGQYVGPVVAVDHRAGLIKYSRNKAVELPFNALAEGQSKPKLGETVRMKFTDGDVAVSVAERSSRDVGR